MKKIYYLSTCDNCQAIIKSLDGLPGFDRQDIRSHPLSEEQIDVLQKLAGSYEALFSKRARLYHEWKLRERTPGRKGLQEIFTGRLHLFEKTGGRMWESNFYWAGEKESGCTQSLPSQYQRHLSMIGVVRISLLL